MRISGHGIVPLQKALALRFSGAVHRPALTLPTACTCHKRLLTSSGTKEATKYFITTPIFYANASPHIGHLYTCLLADTAARWQRILGNDVLFSTGTDEHGLKIQEAASKSGSPHVEFCDAISAQFKNLFEMSSISNTDYIRTTEERHKRAVNHFWTTLQDKGFIYKGTYAGWYSVSDEAFVSEEDVVDSTTEKGQKVSKETGHVVTWMEEENYMFRLSHFKDQLNAWLDKGVIHPAVFTNRVKDSLTNLKDLSVSRSKNRLSWGIPVPGDANQTIYVWLDALVNYLTVGGYPDPGFLWPADCHIVGKDIIKFHAIYWPAFLLAAGLELPKRIFCHSHWTVDGIKMSKSLGNVVDPVEKMEKFTPDAFRYYLLRDGVPHSDGNYGDVMATNSINSELVNKLGNLLHRTTAPKVNPEQIYPRKQADVYLQKFTAADRETFENLDMLVDLVGEHYEAFHFHQGVDSIMSYIQWANGLLQNHQPWVLVKSSDSQDQDHLKVLLHISLETLRVTGILLQPIIPNISCRLLDRLGIPADKRTASHAKQPYLNSPDKLPLGRDIGVLVQRVRT